MLETKQAHKQKVINNCHHKLMVIEVAIRGGLRGLELQMAEEYRTKLELRLMALYGTEKYGLVSN